MPSKNKKNKKEGSLDHSINEKANKIVKNEENKPENLITKEEGDIKINKKSTETTIKKSKPQEVDQKPNIISNRDISQEIKQRFTYYSDTETEKTMSENEMSWMQQDKLISEGAYEIFRKQKENFYTQIENKLDDLAQLLDKKFQSITDEYNKEIKETIQNLKKKVEKKIDSPLKPIETRPQADRKFFLEKMFGHRESLLSILFSKSDSIKTIYNITVAIMCTLFLSLLMSEYKKTGTFFDIQTWFWIFNKPDVVFNTWMRIFLINLIILPFVQWVHYYKPRKFLWITIYTLYQAFLYYYSTKSCLENSFNFGSCMIICCECARLSMKMHSYLRNKLLFGSELGLDHRYFIVKSVKNQIDEKDIYIPPIKIEKISKELQKYMYFLFAPTLIYRDRYIKGPRTNYKMMIAHFVNFGLCIYYAFILFKIFILEVYQPPASKPNTLLDFSITIFRTCLPATFLLFLMFFGLLHSWFNAWAELLRFPDRFFYEDWWNALEYGTYYRKWNIVVHEWLYYYIYLDVIRFSREKISKFASQMLVFIFSAVIHEWIIAVSLGYFYPILFIIFIGPGIILIRGTKNAKQKYLNIVFWLLMFIGTSLLIVLYSMEYYARKDHIVDKEKWGYLFYLAPRILLVEMSKQQTSIYKELIWILFSSQFILINA